ncbi:MAG: hypothetical protein EBY32_20620 [Proteobacteria bacterium]|nr:hypothetical protein [Pseudomonadota bacterium]
MGLLLTQWHWVSIIPAALVILMVLAMVLDNPFVYKRAAAMSVLDSRILHAHYMWLAQLLLLVHYPRMATAQ